MTVNHGIWSGMLVAAALLCLPASASHGKDKGKSTKTVRVVGKHHKVVESHGKGHAFGHGTPKPGRRESSADFDRDGIPNHRDRDDDNDGIIDSRDHNDYSPRRVVRTSTDWRYDLDRDGITDKKDRDVDNDGYRNEKDRYPRNPRRH